VPDLSRHYRVHTYDLRGFGDSDNPSGRYSVQQHAYDLYEFLKATKLDSIILVGFSMGGWISQQFMIDYPEMVRALVLSNTTSGLNAEGVRRFIERGDKVEAVGMEAVADEQIRNVFTPDTIANRPELVSFYRENFLNETHNHYKAYAKMFRALAVPDFKAFLGRIACPVLVVCGDSDQGITRGKTPTDAAEIICSGIRDARLKVVKNAGHYAHLEQAGQWNRIVIEFIDEVLGRT
jgi:3-oxoadipate enol-lactonase